MINKLIPLAEENNEWKELATLYWESHLVWQHTAMAEMSKPEGEQDAQVKEQGIEKMTEFAEKAKDVIEEHEIEDMAGGAYRFLGRAATYAGDHEKAKQYYEEAISRYSGKNLRSKLEVSGFLAESLIRLEDTDAGLALAKKILDDYFNSELGKEVKESDYFVWAVWMSGVYPRIVSALVESGQEFDKDEIAGYLNKTKNELENPSGEVTWGDDKFQFRLDEINSSLQKLQ